MQESNTLVASLFQHRLRLCLLRKTPDQFHQRFHALTGYVFLSFYQNRAICFCNIEEISENRPDFISKDGPFSRTLTGGVVEKGNAFTPRIFRIAISYL